MSTVRVTVRVPKWWADEIQKRGVRVVDYLRQRAGAPVPGSAGWTTPTLLDPVLCEYDRSQKIGTVKSIREYSGRGLKESLEIADSLPKSFCDMGIPREHWDEFANRMRSLGAVVR